MSEFTLNGLVLDTLPEIQKKISDDLKSAHGQDFKSDDPQSIAGQDVAIFSGQIRELEELLFGVVQAFDPNGAKGFFLSQLVQFNGITRNKPKKSTVSLTVTALSAATIIPKGSIATDTGEQVEWIIDDDVALDPYESKVVSATAKIEGPFSADPNTITVIKTPIYSWGSVDNLTKASVGQIEEKDEALRIRRTRVSKQTGQCSAPAIFRTITEIEGVTDAFLYINEGDTVDTYGVNPGNVWAIVRGGSDADVARILAENVSAGTTTHGSIEIIHTDEHTTPSGVTYSKDYARRFDRPVDVPITVRVYITKRAGYPVDGDEQMKQQIVDYFNGDFVLDGRKVDGFGISDTVIRTELYSACHSVPGHSVNQLRIARDGEPVSDDNVPIEIYEQSFISTENIFVYEGQGGGDA